MAKTFYISDRFSFWDLLNTAIFDKNPALEVMGIIHEEGMENDFMDCMRKQFEDFNRIPYLEEVYGWINTTKADIFKELDIEA